MAIARTPRLTYRGQSIFGAYAKMVSPPEQAYRAMERFLPGVDGARIYRLGRGMTTFGVRGRLTGTSSVDLALKCYAGRILCDGQLGLFVADGETLANVMMRSFKPGPIQRVTGNAGVVFTCVIDATFAQVAP